jgi:acyl-CoA synthetase (NDP forming)
VWKGGLTESGARAVSSHTGSMAGTANLWKAFYAQTGAVPVGSLEEIVDAALAFQHLRPATGKRALLIGGGGGNSVALADICSREGLDVPRVTDHTRQQLNSFIRLAGNSTRNPMDLWSVQENPAEFKKMLDIALADPNIDVVILDRHVWANDGDDQDHAERHRRSDEYAIECIKHASANKPMVVAVSTMGLSAAAASYRARYWKRLVDERIPTYPSTTSAAKALSRFLDYHAFLSKVKGRE